MLNLESKLHACNRFDFSKVESISCVLDSTLASRFKIFTHQQTTYSVIKINFKINLTGYICCIYLTWHYILTENQLETGDREFRSTSFSSFKAQTYPPCLSWGALMFQNWNFNVMCSATSNCSNTQCDFCFHLSRESGYFYEIEMLICSIFQSSK